MGKIGHFLGKIKSLHAQQEKTRKNRIILTKKQENTLIFLQAFSHTFPENLLYLGKIGGFLGKIRALLGKMLNEIKITSKREKKRTQLIA